jgi:hypothetical protein
MIIRFKWNLVLLFFGLCNCSSGMITVKKSPPDCFLFQLDCMDFPWFLEACICSLRNAPYISSKTWICHILVDKKLAVDKHANSPCLQSNIWTSWQILYVLVAALLDQALIKWFTCWMIFLPALPLSEEHRARNTQAFQISMTVRFLLAIAFSSYVDLFFAIS